MIGVGHPLMGVRNLRYRQQSQQNHAHGRDNRKGAGPSAASRCA